MVPSRTRHPDKRSSTRNAGKTGTEDASAAQVDKDGIQGEGNYEAARRFNDAERKFVASGKVESAARAAKPKSEAERRQMIEAEEQGKRRAKEEDPALTKPWPDAPATNKPQRKGA